MVRPLPLFSVGLLLLLSGCCETQGEVSCTLDGVAVADARIAGALAEDCGWGVHYPGDRSASRLILLMKNDEETLRVRLELQPVHTDAFSLPAPGQSNASVVSYELSLPPGVPALTSGELRFEESPNLLDAAKRIGVVTLGFENGMSCQVAFNLCRDSGVDIGEPPPSSRDDDDDFDWDD